MAEEVFGGDDARAPIKGELPGWMVFPGSEDCVGGEGGNEDEVENGVLEFLWKGLDLGIEVGGFYRHS